MIVIQKVILKMTMMIIGKIYDAYMPTIYTIYDNHNFLIIMLYKSPVNTQITMSYHSIR